LTVLDGDSYVGEALMERLKPGEERFISYALDLGTLVTTDAKDDREPVFLIRAINGTFQTHYYQAKKKTYAEMGSLPAHKTSRNATGLLNRPALRGAIGSRPRRIA